MSVLPRSSRLLVLVLLLTSCFPIQPATTERTYLDFSVCYINTTPKEIPQGTSLIVIFGVFYSDYSPCGDPAVLQPRTGQTGPTGDFTVIGSPAINYKDIKVVPTGKPGEYRSELLIPTDVPIGQRTVFIIKESLYDGKTKGPERETGYVETPDPIDNSAFFLRSASPIIALFDFIPGGVLSILILLALAVLFVILLFVRRSKRTSQQTDKLKD